MKSSEYKREDWFLQVFNDQCSEVTAARARLHLSLDRIAFMEGEKRGPNWEGKVKVAHLTKQLIDALHRLPNRDYRPLVGHLNLARSEECKENFLSLLKQFERQGCGPTASQAVDRIRRIYDTVRRFDEVRGIKRGKFDSEMAGDTLLLLRSVYQFGVNIKSPDWAAIQDLSIMDRFEPVFF